MNKRLIIPGLVFFMGLVILGQGGAIKAKALLAQILLNNAWAESLDEDSAIKPWPWADISPVARITVPELDVDMVVLDSVSGQALAFGPGRIASLSELGGPGTAIIAGHRDTHFAFLEQIRPGHDIWLQTRDGKKHHYAVIETQAIETANVTLSDNRDGSRLILVTCYPFDGMVAGGPLRYLVFAERTEMI